MRHLNRAGFNGWFSWISEAAYSEMLASKNEAYLNLLILDSDSLIPLLTDQPISTAQDCLDSYQLEIIELSWHETPANDGVMSLSIEKRESTELDL